MAGVTVLADGGELGVAVAVGVAVGVAAADVAAEGEGSTVVVGAALAAAVGDAGAGSSPEEPHATPSSATPMPSSRAEHAGLIASGMHRVSCRRALAASPPAAHPGGVRDPDRRIALPGPWAGNMEVGRR